MSEAGEAGCLSSSREQVPTPSTFLFHSGPQRLDDDRPHWRRQSSHSVYDANANLLQRYPHTPRNHTSLAIWASLSLGKVTHNINHHSTLQTWWYVWFITLKKITVITLFIHPVVSRFIYLCVALFTIRTNSMGTVG